MFLPTHEILIVKNDDSEESIEIADCSTKSEVREDAKDWFKENKITNYENFKAIRYVNSKKEILYECSISELFN